MVDDNKNLRPERDDEEIREASSEEKDFDASSPENSQEETKVPATPKRYGILFGLILGVVFALIMWASQGFKGLLFWIISGVISGLTIGVFTESVAGNM